MFKREILSLYFIAGTQDCLHRPETQAEDKLLATLENALKSGITCFQFREKGARALQDTARIERLAYACRDLCRQFSVPFVINNDVLLAVKMGADGVHIGQKDMPAEQAAALCANRLFLGISNNTLAHVARSKTLDYVDYLAVGPIFATESKSDASEPVGLDFIRKVRAMRVTQPLVAIGGITRDNASAVCAAGADGVAVISALAQADDIGAAARDLLRV
ncbi:thiamine phosphate synthase [Neisseriaceae bacterium B1]